MDLFTTPSDIRVRFEKVKKLSFKSIASIFIFMGIGMKGFSFRILKDQLTIQFRIQGREAFHLKRRPTESSLNANIIKRKIT